MIRNSTEHMRVKCFTFMALFHKTLRLGVSRRLRDEDMQTVQDAPNITVTTFTYELWVVAERMRSQIQVAEMNFLRRDAEPERPTEPAAPSG